MNEIWVALAGIISTIGTGFGSWFFARRKYNTEVDASNIENLKSTLEFYSTIADDNKQRLQELLENNHRLEKEIIAVKAENNALKETIERQTEVIEDLTKQVKKLQTAVNKL